MKFTSALSTPWCSVAVLAVSILNLQNAVAEDEAPVPRVTIPAAWYFPAPDGLWHGNPPGFKKEWGWTQFPKLDNFELREGGRPTQKTEVRIFYTPKTLYVAAKLFDARIENMVAGVSPQDYPKDAPLEWLADVFEIFISPEPETGQYFQFGVNPSGARFDQAKGKNAPGKSWDARWRAGTQVFKDCWQVEIAIEISSLALRGKFVGTPRIGDTMAITFCRSAGHWKEYSSWGLPGTWHRVEKFGRVQFGPRLPTPSFKTSPRDPDDVIVEHVDAGSPDLGARKLIVSLRNPGRNPIELSMALMVGDQKMWSLDPVKMQQSTRKLVLPPKSKKKVEVNYVVTEGRGPMKRMVFTIRRPEYAGPSYYSDCRFKIYPLQKKVAGMQDLLKRIEQVCAKAPQVLDASACRARAGVLLERLRVPADPQTPPTKAIPAARSIESDVGVLQLQFANRVRPQIHAAIAGPKRAGFVVGSVPSSIKVLPELPYEGPLGEPVKIALAKNERESAQFVILSTTKQKTEVRFEVGELRGPGNAVIPGTRIKTFRVGTVLIETPSPVHNGLWPDPIYPTDRTPLSPGAPQAVMVTVHCPSDAAAGNYRGRVTFAADGYDAVRVPFEVQVYDFELPDRMSLFNEIWWDATRPSVYYPKITPELFEKFAWLAKEYHVTPSIDAVVVKSNLKYVGRKDGSIDYDWSGVDPYLRVMRKYGRHRQNINFTNNWRGWSGFFESGIYYFVPGRSQARLYRCPDPIAEYGRFLKSSYDHLVAMGWKPEDLYYAGGDEPWAQQVRDEMRPGYEKAKEATPPIRRTSAAAHPGMANISDIIEIWCPQVREFRPDAYRKDSREVWMYTCGWKNPPYPCYSIHVPGMAARITGWMCRKFDVTGFLYWGSNVWEVGNNINVVRAKPPAEKRWVRDGWKPALSTGDGILYYPTPDGPIACQRLICIRDGTEDYEYLTLLKRLAKGSKSAPARLVQEAMKLASVPNPLVKSTTEWTMDISQLESARARAAELIVALSK